MNDWSTRPGDGDVAASKVAADAQEDKAPDPRRHYASPEDLQDDINLDLKTREELLREWRADLDRRLESKPKA